MKSERPLVLVVDDSRIVRQRVKEILSREGFGVVLKENGEEGVLAALEYDPDIILMDVNMPVMNGVEACRLIKKHKQTMMIPLCVFTDESSLDLKVDLFNIGVEDFINKNFSEAEIVARIKALLRLRELRDQIIGGRERLERIIDSLSDSVIIFDDNLKLVLFNRAAAANFGLIPELIMDKGIEEIFGNLQSTSRLIEMVKQCEEIENYELELVINGEGKVFSVDTRMVELSFCKNDGCAVIMKDITAQKETERLKADFYSMIAHELRTPISVILGYTQLMLEGKVGEVNELHREFIESINEKGKALMSLVNDFLEISRFERKAIRIEKANFNIVELVSETIDGIRLLAENRNISLSFSFSQQRIEVYADRDKMSHVFINLIENAIKYTEEGGRIDVRAEEKDGGAEVSISDTGIGMSEEELGLIFDMYQRLQNAERKKIKGTGLGLAIVKEIIDAHDGRIEVESREGEGSTFRVWIPGGEKEPEVSREDSSLVGAH